MIPYCNINKNRHCLAYDFLSILSSTSVQMPGFVSPELDNLYDKKGMHFINFHILVTINQFVFAR